MGKGRLCVECVIKLAAFLGALMSVVILTLSTLVLISSINNKAVNSTSSSSEDSSQTTPVIPSDYPNPTDYIPGSKNATDQESSPLENPRELHISESETTTSTSSPREIEDDHVAGEPKPKPTSSNTSPVLEAGENDTDDSNNSTLLVSTSLSVSANEAEAKPWNSFFERQESFWRDKSDTYIILMEASSGTGIFAAVLQLSFSLLLLCGSGRKDLRDRTTLWNLSNFIVLILSIVIILLPISYNNTTDTFKKGSVFWRDLCRMMTDSLQLSRTLERVWNNFENFLTRNFTLYYYVLGVNSFILMAFLVFPTVSCLCLPCRKFCCRRKYEDDGKTESDLMLFETGGDPFRHY